MGTKLAYDLYLIVKLFFNEAVLVSERYLRVDHELLGSLIVATIFAPRVLSLLGLRIVLLTSTDEPLDLEVLSLLADLGIEVTRILLSILAATSLLVLVNSTTEAVLSLRVASTLTSLASAHVLYWALGPLTLTALLGALVLLLELRLVRIEVSSVRLALVDVLVALVSPR